MDTFYLKGHTELFQVQAENLKFFAYYINDNRFNFHYVHIIFRFVKIDTEKQGSVLVE